MIARFQNSLKIYSGFMLFVALIATVSTTTSAQDMNVDEVIVTSTHRAKSVQDIPVTVSVLGEDLIADADVHDATGIAINSPGLTYGEFSPGQAIFAMRGIGSADDGAGMDNSVGVFLDGVYVGRGAAVNFDAVDLERIEVLKGPQGALFGRNTIGGAISVVTAKPSLEEVMRKVQLTIGNEGILRAQGMMTGPVSENVAVKFVASHRQHDGFVRNTLLNRDVDDEDKTSIRGQLLASGKNSEWIVSADYTKDDRREAGRFPFVNGNFDYLGTARSLGANRSFTTASPITGFSDRETYGLTLNGDIEVDGGSIISITGYRNMESDWEMPAVGAPLGGAYDLDAGVYGSDVNDDIFEDIDAFSQELRFVSDFAGSVNFVAGLYFFNEKTDRIEEFHIARNTEADGQVNVGTEYTRTENDTESYAAYGQMTYDVDDALTLIVGGRYTYDNKDYVATAVNCGMSEEDRAAAGFANFEACTNVGGSLGIIAETFRVSVSENWSDFSPMGSIQYRVNDDLMIFGTIATGYKSGGFAGSQGVESAASTPVDPEEATNYELGFKSELLDGTLRLNTTAFFMDYKDLQIVRFGPVPNSEFGTFLTTNIGSAEIQGVELDWDWFLSNNFSLSGNYAYLDTEIKQIIINTTDVSGKTLNRAPRHSVNIIGDYSIPGNFYGGSIDLRAQYSYGSDQRHDYLADATISESAALVDASLEWSSSNDAYSFKFWGKNLANEAYTKHSFVIGPGVIGVWGDPRTYGVTFSAKF